MEAEAERQVRLVLGDDVDSCESSGSTSEEKLGLAGMEERAGSPSHC